MATAVDQFIWGTGRRKTSVARVRIREGTGQFIVNKLEANVYFPLEVQRTDVRAPLTLTEMGGRVDVFVNVRGGGKHSQSGAVQLGLARRLRSSARTSIRPSATPGSSPETPEWSSGRSSATRRPARASSSRSVDAKAREP